MNDLQFRFRHTMLPVGNLARSVDFYTRLLGMKVQRERMEGPGGHNVAYVGYGDEGTHPVLELIENTGNHDKPWKGHIAIAVSDVPALVEKLKAEGVRFIRPVAEPKSGTNVYIAFICDPDGFEIEINQRKGGIYN
ncbi:MAG: lactoylglutathione lyase [Pseudomonadota bacterium]|jgi:lactoylglutathione lyase